nr:hypothetical protein [Actinomycetota bacterium]
MTGTEVYAPFTSAEPAAQSPPAIASPATKKSSPTILIPVAIVLALIALAVVKSSGTSKPKSYDTALELAADLQSHGLCDDRTEMPGVWGDTEAGCKAHGQGMNVFVNTPGSGVASILAELEQSSADFSFDHAPVVGPNWVVST